MPQMAKPWPSPEVAVSLPLRERALRLLDRLDVTPDDPMNSLLRKDWFVNREVSEAVIQRRRRAGMRGTTAVSSDEALAAEPELARAWGEAWDYCLRQGWLADDPARPPFVYVTNEGKSALLGYRDATASAPAAQGPTAAAAAEPEKEAALPASEAEPTATPPLSVADPAAARPEKRETFWDKWVRPTLLTLIGAGLLALIAWGIATLRGNGGAKATISVTAESDPDRIVSGGRRLGAFYVIPRRVGAIPAPPFKTDHCVGRYAWARRLGGVEVDMPLQFTVTATGGDVTIRGFRVDIERKDPPVRGSEIECRGRGQGGAEHRMILVDLWRTRPASWQLAPTPADPNPTFVIPLEQERQIVFDVVARSHGCLCRWRAAFTYSVGNGPRRTVSLPVKNAPAFATTSAGRALRYHWNGRRWQFLGQGLP